MKRKIKFALIGCGRISKKHIDSITGYLSNRAELVSVCDIKSNRAKDISEKYNIPWYVDYHEMLIQHPEIDVVNILTESGLHAKHTIDVVDHFQKNVVVEKPMALTLEDADEMIRVCDINGVKLFVVKQNRYNLPVIQLRKAIESGRFGKIVMGSVRVRWCRTQEYYNQDSWRGTWKMDGGVFTNQASHHIDLLEWMIGEPVSVFAKSRTALVNIETEDTGAAIVQFKNGAIGIIEATTATRPVDLEGSLSILGENGCVEIGGFAVNEMKVWNFVDKKPEEDLIIDKMKEMPSDQYGFGHNKYLENVCDSVSHQKKALVDGLEGRKSLELIHAIYESIETGKEVFLKFKSENCKLGRNI